MSVYIRFEEHAYDEGGRLILREVELGPFEYVETELREVRTDQHEVSPLATLYTPSENWHYKVQGQQGVFHQYTLYTKGG